MNSAWTAGRHRRRTLSGPSRPSPREERHDRRSADSRRRGPAHLVRRTRKGPVQAVDGVTLRLRPGEVLGLVGESGCGKSTLGRGLMGLLPRGAASTVSWSLPAPISAAVAQRAGEVTWRRNGVDLPGADDPAGSPDADQRPLHRSAEGARTGTVPPQARDRALEALRALGIPPTRYRNYPHEFSGGMRQRIMIALALALRAEVHRRGRAHDRPGCAGRGADPAHSRRHPRRYSAAILLITHNLGIVAEACDRVAVMYAGKSSNRARCAMSARPSVQRMRSSGLRLAA